MVMANLPPMPPVPVPVVTTIPVAQPQTTNSSEPGPSTSSANVINPTANATSKETEDKIDKSPPQQSTSNSDVKLEDIGSEDFLDLERPSTSKAVLSPSISTTSSNILDTTNIVAENNSDSPESPGEVNEIRKRRLQKFLQND